MLYFPLSKYLIDEFPKFDYISMQKQVGSWSQGRGFEARQNKKWKSLISVMFDSWLAFFRDQWSVQGSLAWRNVALDFGLANSLS